MSGAHSVNTKSLKKIAAVAGGELTADAEFTSVSTDTRTIKPGALFVALKGPNFDAHNFVAQAAEKGAVAALVSQRVPASIPQLIVSDVLAALSTYAREWRRQFKIPVIGITGSNGKTTTKEMLGSILSRAGTCLVTRGNLNNHIGVPLMLLELAPAHRYAVIEMGASALGEIGHLASLAEPTIGLITNVGAAHLEGFGSLDGVAQGKGELFTKLDKQGIAAINLDEPYADLWRSTTTAGRTITFGLAPQSDVIAQDIEMTSDPDGGFHTQFDLVYGGELRPVTLSVAGTHNVRNALGAAAAALAAGATIDQVAAGLGAMRAVQGRLNLIGAIGGAHLLDDSYNANPSSIRAGIDALKLIQGERWLVLGDMMELGPTSDDLHGEIGDYAQRSGLQRLFAIGPRSQHAVQGFGAGALWFENMDALIAALRANLNPRVVMLVKGSRSSRMERVTQALAEGGQRVANGH
jgi:UDP-N-acetylmuramoyl-tripeptide--D-alanyl-D-alanine ligase